MFLEIKNLEKYFGGVKAIADISLTIEEGELLGIIGPNGSGKTTLFNLITGVFHPTKGKVIFQKTDITGLSPHIIAGKGIIRTYQITTTFSNLTALKNVMIGQIMNYDRGIWHALLGNREEEKKMLSKSEDLLEFVGLINERNKIVKNLTQEQQKRLSIAVSLACNPKLLLLDEPTGGVNMDEIRALVDLIQRIRSLGITICLIEHKLKMIMEISKRVIVLNFGTKIAEGIPEAVCKDSKVIKAYLGEEYVA